jgi:GntR family transcriptional regulator
VATHAEASTQYRFLHLVADDPGAARLQRRLLDCRRLRASAEVARALGLRSGEAVIQVRRLLLQDAQPVVLDDIYLPGTLFKGLSVERMDSYKGPMYRLFEAEFGVRMIRAEERLRAVAAEALAAQLLATAPGVPLLSVERLSFTYDDKPVELRRGLYRTEHHHYRNELN